MPAEDYTVLCNYMNLRGGRRESRTWLAIQASTKASTSGDLRILAHSAAEKRRAPSRTMMGELLIAATSARTLPQDESRPIDALQNPRAAALPRRPIPKEMLAGGGSSSRWGIVAEACLPVRIDFAQF
jgi:hypothetical protein